MDALLGFVFGIIVGGIIGVALMCLLCVNRDMEDDWKRRDE